MADSVLRALERRYHATRSAVDELAWLNERLRAGQRLDWASYARLADLAPQDAAAYLDGLVRQGALRPERLGLAACVGHQPARIAQRWVITEPDTDGLGMLRFFWVKSHESAALSFELVRAVVVHLVELACARGAWAPAERDAALEALEDCSPGSPWSARTRDRLARRIVLDGGAPGAARQVREGTLRAVKCVGNDRRGAHRLGRALQFVEEAAAALGDPPPRWEEVLAPVLLGPRPRRSRARTIHTQDGFARFTCLASRARALQRLRATKEFLFSSEECLLAFDTARVSNGRFFGAMLELFGRPHDVHDDWKQSISYYLDVKADPARRGRPDLKPVRLLLRVADWKGSLELQLRGPWRRGQDSRQGLEDVNDVLPADLRVQVLSFFLGYVEGVASRTPLPDFEREYAYGEVQGLRYGVNDGVPFDEAQGGG